METQLASDPNRFTQDLFDGLPRRYDRTDPVRYPELAVDALEMTVHRPRRDAQPATDRVRGQSISEEPKHGQLTTREPRVGSGRGPSLSEHRALPIEQTEQRLQLPRHLEVFL